MLNDCSHFSLARGLKKMSKDSSHFSLVGGGGHTFLLQRVRETAKRKFTLSLAGSPKKY